jgi:hypothetical protein
VAYEESVRSITLNADATLAVYTGVPGAPGSPNDNAGKQYRGVKVTGVHQVGVASAATDAVVGIVQNKPQATGHAATVAIRGVSKVRMATTITAGAVVYLAADGRGTSAGTPGTTTELGLALTTGSAADELVPVLLRVN